MPRILAAPEASMDLRMRSDEVFLIDDDDDLRFTIGLSLRDAGLSVKEFASADEARQMLDLKGVGNVKF